MTYYRKRIQTKISKGPGSMRCKLPDTPVSQWSYMDHASLSPQWCTKTCMKYVASHKKLIWALESRVFIGAWLHRYVAPTRLTLITQSPALQRSNWYHMAKISTMNRIVSIDYLAQPRPQVNKTTLPGKIFQELRICPRNCSRVKTFIEIWKVSTTQTCWVNPFLHRYLWWFPRPG